MLFKCELNNLRDGDVSDIKTYKPVNYNSF